MMKPVQDRQRDDLPGGLRAPAHWLLLVHALMRAGGVVETHEFRDQLSQVRLVEDEHMIEQLSSERPDEAFRERVRVRSPRCGPHDARASAFECLDEPLPERAVPRLARRGWRK